MNGADIIREVSLDLNDQEPGYEYTRWPVAQLQSYLREALLHVGKRMQDWFVERVVLEVQPGPTGRKVVNAMRLSASLEKAPKTDD